MSEPVLDSSILLAVMRSETIDEKAYAIVPYGVMSAVNVAEVYTKLSDLGMQTNPRIENLLGSLDRIESFTPRQAYVAGQLRSMTRHAGPSLGDRACIALALELGSEVYTVDRNWLRVDVGCPIHCLR